MCDLPNDGLQREVDAELREQVAAPGPGASTTSSATTTRFAPARAVPRRAIARSGLRAITRRSAVNYWLTSPFTGVRIVDPSHRCPRGALPMVVAGSPPNAPVANWPGAARAGRRPGLGSDFLAGVRHDLAMNQAACQYQLALPGVLEHRSGWFQLRGAGSNKQVPPEPGLYRVRLLASARVLLYIGQTGRSLRARLGQLNAAYGPDMPFNDPHTAAPALWALLHRDRCDFEASVTEVPGSTPHRMGLEAAALTLYRARLGRSPLANFGGMPAGYRKSTGNNARLVAARRRERGGPDPSAPIRPTSAPVHGDLGTAPSSAGG
jgi:hypothetical protein